MTKTAPSITECGFFNGGDGGIRTHVPAHHRQNDFEGRETAETPYISA